MAVRRGAIHLHAHLGVPARWLPVRRWQLAISLVASFLCAPKEATGGPRARTNAATVWAMDDDGGGEEEARVHFFACSMMRRGEKNGAIELSRQSGKKDHLLSPESG